MRRAWIGTLTGRVPMRQILMAMAVSAPIAALPVQAEMIVLPSFLELSESGVLTLDYLRMGGCGRAQVGVDLEVVTDTTTLGGLTEEQRELLAGPELKVLVQFVLKSDDQCKRAAIREQAVVELTTPLRELLKRQEPIILIIPRRDGSLWLKTMKF